MYNSKKWGCRANLIEKRRVPEQVAQLIGEKARTNLEESLAAMVTQSVMAGSQASFSSCEEGSSRATFFEDLFVLEI